MSFNIIAAIDKNRGISRNNRLPWPRLKKDLTYLKHKISGKPVLCGRKTFEQLNNDIYDFEEMFIVSSSKDIDYKHENVYNNVEFALDGSMNKHDKIWVLGGQDIYKNAVNDFRCDKIYLTEINKNYNCDKFFPHIRTVDNGGQYQLIKDYPTIDEKTGIEMNFKIYQNIVKIRTNEQQYLDMVNRILDDGNIVNGRNGETKSCFSFYHTFDLQEGFPILTTKRINFDLVVKELLFFLKGDTNAKNLNDIGVKFWNANTSREFLDNRGLNHYDVGLMGPMYGHNFRRFGQNYDPSDLYTQKDGIDQLKLVIDGLLNHPHERRHIMTSFDPFTVDKCVLYPCHGLVIQFYVEQDKLNLQMYQRSADVMLGYPFNIASYALMLHIIANLTGYKPGKLHTIVGDGHIYKNHYKNAKIQTSRYLRKQPKLLIRNINKLNNTEDIINKIDSLEPEQFSLKNYFPHKQLKFKMEK